MKLAAPFIFFLLFISAAFSQSITRGPYIQNLKTDTVEILWRTDKPAESWVWIRALDNKGDFAFYYSNVPSAIHQMKVPNLKPDVEYEYCAGFGPGVEKLSPAQTFHTLPPEGSRELSFIVYGDHRNYSDRHRAVVEAILTQMETRGTPNFILDTGDYTGQGEHKTDFWDEQFFEPARGLIERVCYFPLIGNHESERKHPRIPFRYLENFSVPTESSGTEYYYSFDAGDAHFVVLDVYATDFSTDSKQWHWLREDLKKTKKTWRFATMHYPIYIHRSGPSVSFGNEDIREHLVPLFERYGVAAVFSGDSHFYQRSEVNGINYICSGGGGAPLYDPGSDPEYVKASAKKNHYVWATIDKNELTLEAFDDSNNMLDKTVFGPREPVKPKPLALNFQRNMPDATMTPSESIIVESCAQDGTVTSAPIYLETGTMSYSSAKSAAEGLEGKRSRFSGNEAPDARVRFAPILSRSGTYLLSVTVPATGSADAPGSYFEVFQKGKMTVRGRVDLTSANAGGKWYDVGLITLSPGDYVELIEAPDQPARFYCDAMRFTFYAEK